ncbi:hypothetical protein V8J36_22775 [Frigidibacter sp. MR17.14]|uniref:hypothetical protein n=1 Tax=Frigidibacter sp. MR17.14 TaxID=3126509 RepID=UPI0030130E27
MFDAFTPTTETVSTQVATDVQAAPDWREALKPGDIVAFRFPDQDALDPEAQPKVRPALVMLRDKTADGATVTLAFGTTRGAFRFHDYPYDRRYGVGVWSIAEIEAANLHRATGFACERRITVSLDDPRFAASKRGTPVIGTLGARTRERFLSVLARIIAERDIAAWRRAECLKEIVVAGRRVEVVHRRKGERMRMTPPMPTLAMPTEVRA